MPKQTRLPGHRIRNLQSGITCLAAAFLLFGCFGKQHPQPEIHQYLLHYDAASASVATEPLPVVLRFERFQTAPSYDTKRIVYRKSDQSVREYTYHRWRADPGEMIGDQLRRDFEASCRFRAVLTPVSTLPYDHVLEGTVNHFFEDDRNDRWEAAVGITLTLLAEPRPDGVTEILFQQRYAEREVAVRNHPRAVAEAMTRAVERISRKALEDVVGALSAGGGLKPCP
jgi:cholesterol transport system auxiliary component